ncbi:hypothetical protein IE982_13785 [Enterobacter hormaechei]|uniref:Uncharacterized protein n=1 Tax=Enterobacter hormaechei TaxID=158836 RepID=A0A927DJR6_9ENTR|nr:hypothetical protein [Enterobacter hormaechei]MBD3706999.1 hypothetical protein [Enterobacter hormaechei]
MLSWSRSIRLLFQNLLICLGCDYFNSGVLYVDARTWNENKISHKVFECLLERGADFKYFDQDALNVVLNEKIMFIDGKYNCQIKAGHKRKISCVNHPMKQFCYIMLVAINHGSYGINSK